MINLKKFIKKINKAFSYWGTTIPITEVRKYIYSRAPRPIHPSKYLYCYFCHKPLAFVGNHGLSVGDCYRCAIDYDLNKVETIWNVASEIIAGYNLYFIHNKKEYVIHYVVKDDANLIYLKGSNAPHHEIKGEIFTLSNAVSRAKTVLVFS